MTSPLRVLVAGCGKMGASHARAYHKMPEFEIVGLVSRGPASRGALSKELGGLPEFDDYYDALAATRPDVVSINTYPETHGPYARAAIKAGCHVFCEKPLAETRRGGPVHRRRRARERPQAGHRLHPARAPGLDPVHRARADARQAAGHADEPEPAEPRRDVDSHRNLMNSMSPIVDCGVHYVDVMCQMTGARPVRVSAIGARLSDELKPGMYNYGQLQVTFDDGSVGWYEAGLGPDDERGGVLRQGRGRPEGVRVDREGPERGDRQGLGRHRQPHEDQLHPAAPRRLDASNEFVKPDELINTEDEPDHQGLCDREQAYLLRAIQQDVDLSDHMHDAVNSLRIVLAADESVRTGQIVTLDSAVVGAKL